MNILLVLAHPDPDSFNAAIAQTVRGTLLENGHHVVFHDLYREKFDPLLPAGEIACDADMGPMLASHCEELASADGVVVIHPNWWGQPPAILKGWVDRVFRPDVAYRFLEDDQGEGVPVGLLKAKAAVIFNTSNTPLKREEDVFGDPLERLWKSCIFQLCGVENFYRRTFSVMVTSSLGQREKWLQEVVEVINRFFPGD